MKWYLKFSLILIFLTIFIPPSFGQLPPITETPVTVPGLPFVPKEKWPLVVKARWEKEGAYVENGGQSNFRVVSLQKYKGWLVKPWIITEAGAMKEEELYVISGDQTFWERPLIIYADGVIIIKTEEGGTRAYPCTKIEVAEDDPKERERWLGGLFPSMPWHVIQALLQKELLIKKEEKKYLEKEKLYVKLRSPTVMPIAEHPNIESAEIGRVDDILEVEIPVKELFEKGYFKTVSEEDSGSEREFPGKMHVLCEAHFFLQPQEDCTKVKFKEGKDFIFKKFEPQPVEGKPGISITRLGEFDYGTEKIYINKDLRGAPKVRLNSIIVHEKVHFENHLINWFPEPLFGGEYEAWRREDEFYQKCKDPLEIAPTFEHELLYDSQGNLRFCYEVKRKFEMELGHAFTD